MDQRESAEDCTHEVFIRVHNKALLYKPGMKFSPWLYRIARNMAFNALRMQKTRQAVSLQKPVAGLETAQLLESMIASEEKDPREQLESEELIGLLKAAIAKLSEKDRQVVVLCAIEKMPHKEAADILGWPVARVTLQLHRAKHKLASLLGEMTGGGSEESSKE